MVYVVERYLPGLLHSDLLHGLSNLERSEELTDEGQWVRYLGSTIVLEDEACYCRFDGPSEAAVAEANRKAGLSFHRIVPAVTVNAERRTTMNVSTTIPPRVRIRLGRLLVISGAVAVLAAAVTWVLLAFALGTDGGKAAARPSGITAAGAALDTREQDGPSLVGPLTPAERSVGHYLFGTSSPMTPAQLQGVRDYLFGASRALTPAERSIGYYLFGEFASLTPAQRRTIHSYQIGASAR